MSTQTAHDPGLPVTASTRLQLPQAKKKSLFLPVQLSTRIIWSRSEPHARTTFSTSFVIQYMALVKILLMPNF